MYTYIEGNNALAVVESDIVEELTAYTDKELSLLIENAYNVGVKHGKAKQRKSARRKRKERIESIKLAIVLFAGMIGFPGMLILHWLAVGY